MNLQSTSLALGRLCWPLAVQTKTTFLARSLIPSFLRDAHRTMWRPSFPPADTPRDLLIFPSSPPSFFPSVDPASFTACWIRLIEGLVHGPSPELLAHWPLDLLMMLITINGKPSLRLLFKPAAAAGPRNPHRQRRGGMRCRRLYFFTRRNGLNFT